MNLDKNIKKHTVFYKKPWFAAATIIIVFVLALSIGVNALWKNTFGQINFVAADDDEKEKDFFELTPEEKRTSQSTNQAEKATSPTPYDKNVTNILLLGIDSRDPEKIDERSDAMLILTVHKEQGKLKLTSLQRDMLVEMPGKNMMDKLNHANTYGGPEYVMETVNNTLRLDIDRYVIVNMRGLERIVDLLEGIEIDVQEEAIPFVNKNIDHTNRVFKGTGKSAHINNSGIQTLNGRQALGYARNRSTIGGDYDRMRYQQEVLQGIFSKFLEVGMDTKIDLLKEGFSLVTTNLKTEEILGMVQSVMPLLDEELDTLTIPIEGYHRHYSGAAWLNLCDFNGMIPLIQEFMYGRTFAFDPVAEIPGAPNSGQQIEVAQIDEWVTPDSTDAYGNLSVQEPTVTGTTSGSSTLPEPTITDQSPGSSDTSHSTTETPTSETTPQPPVTDNTTTGTVPTSSSSPSESIVPPPTEAPPSTDSSSNAG